MGQAAWQARQASELPLDVLLDCGTNVPTAHFRVRAQVRWTVHVCGHTGLHTSYMHAPMGLSESTLSGSCRAPDLGRVRKTACRVARAETHCYVACRQHRLPWLRAREAQPSPNADCVHAV